jgi:uncharacterized membrane protein
MLDVHALITAVPFGDCHPSGWWILAPLGWFLVIATFFVFIRFLVFRRRGWGGPWAYGPGGSWRGGRISAGEILERRFAEGELSATEYRERRKVLEDEPAAGREGDMDGG